MEKAEIEKLARLARFELSEDEIERFRSELSSVLAYVGQVSEVTETDGDEAPATDEVYNVLREDGAPHEPGVYTEALLGEAPYTQDGYVKVKKIL